MATVATVGKQSGDERQADPVKVFVDGIVGELVDRAMETSEEMTWERLEEDALKTRYGCLNFTSTTGFKSETLNKTIKRLIGDSGSSSVEDFESLLNGLNCVRSSSGHADDITPINRQVKRLIDEIQSMSALDKGKNNQVIQVIDVNYEGENADATTNKCYGDVVNTSDVSTSMMGSPKSHGETSLAQPVANPEPGKQSNEKLVVVEKKKKRSIGSRLWTLLTRRSNHSPNNK